MGGVIGGTALLVIVGLFLFVGRRRGWFDKRTQSQATRPEVDEIKAGGGETYLHGQQQRAVYPEIEGAPRYPTTAPTGPTELEGTPRHLR